MERLSSQQGVPSRGPPCCSAWALLRLGGGGARVPLTASSGGPAVYGSEGWHPSYAPSVALSHVHGSTYLSSAYLAALFRVSSRTTPPQCNSSPLRPTGAECSGRLRPCSPPPHAHSTASAHLPDVCMSSGSTAGGEMVRLRRRARSRSSSRGHSRKPPSCVRQQWQQWGRLQLGQGLAAVQDRSKGLGGGCGGGAQLRAAAVAAVVAGCRSSRQQC